MTETPAISVVLCTRNRAESLAVTLDSLAATTGMRNTEWEVVVVDNGSTDATPAVLSGWAARVPFPVRIVVEPRAGLSHARNAGVAAARAPLVAFTDDDVSVAPGWVAELLAAFRRFPHAVALGGPILPEWEAPVPDWLTADLHGHLSLLHHGDQPLRLAHADIWGANFAVRAEAFRAGARFDPERGRCGERLFVGEETELLQRLIDRGEAVLYCPEPTVRHRIGPERLTRGYFRRRQFDIGFNDARRDAAEPFRRLCGVPLWALNLAWRALARHAGTLLRGRRPAMAAELETSYRLGYLRGALGRRPAPARRPALAPG